MSEPLSTAIPTSEHKRRKVEVEATLPGHVKLERVKGIVADKAKANYLSGQLRLRLQYAKLKVEHGWQRQNLNEVENLYFRHTHLTRPYPVISPGGRRSGRTLSSIGFSFSSGAAPQENVPAPAIVHRDQTFYVSTSQPNGLGSSSSSRGMLMNTSSSSSGESSFTPSIPSTPVPDTTRIATPLAPHVGFGSTVTRYPISRSDSSQTIIAESTPSLYQGSPIKPSPFSSGLSPSHASGSSSFISSQPAAQSQTTTAFREPFDPMAPTEQVDSQLAALRSMMSASALPIPLPPPSPANPGPLTPVSNNIGSGMSSGLTYDSFWSAHGSATASFRSLIAGQGARSSSGTPLQPHTSAPSVTTPSAVPYTSGSSWTPDGSARAHDTRGPS